MNALEVRDLAKTYSGGPTVLNGVSLVLPSGTITALLGLNGSGKTTTIRSLLGLTSLSAGEVVVMGERVDPFASAHKNMFGAVLDEPTYFEWLTGRESLRLHARMRNVPERVAVERTVELLEYLGLTEARNEPIRTYSTGMKKKLSLATAIIHRPPILVLDEPFEGVDPLAAEDMLETLLLMASSGAAIMVTSHIFDTVERLCTRFEILHEGRIALSCTSADLAAKVSHNGASRSLVSTFFDVVSPGRKHIPPGFLS
jgi:ABC-2 type transport system ATP-binding protein